MQWLGICLLFLTPAESLGGGELDEAITPDELRAAGEVAGLELTAEELELMLPGVIQNLAGYARMRERDLHNAVPPAITFSPVPPGVTAGGRVPEGTPIALPEAKRPDDLRELRFAEIPTLAALIKSRQVSCVELAELSLARLRELDPRLLCVVSTCEERALGRARELDAELAEGKWRGPLHGIPYGAKDLLAVSGTRTTWGAKPFETQVIDADATVVQKLDEAGAVLVAKLTLGALAMGDVWFGGTTKNPWNLEQGSSGSSAGSASAVAAGCVPFAIGTETLGSIVSPARRCGNSAIRPTFGRVSRHGAMALSWTMDKIGPICRSVHDASLVLEAIAGPDGHDPTVIDTPYASPPAIATKGMRIGVPKGAFDRSELHRSVLAEIEALDAEIVEIELPEFPVWEMMVILHAEAATAFDDLTRSGDDDTLTRQDAEAWPNLFRIARMIPAVEYIRAQRLRTLLQREMAEAIAGVDLYVTPGYHGASLGITNLTGHPCIVAPSGFRERGTPYSVAFVGHLFDEARLAAFARAWQESTAYHRRHPDL